MFVCDCPTCGRRELRGPRSLFSVAGPSGPLLASRCRGCDTVVPLVRPALPTPQPTVPAAA